MYLLIKLPVRYFPMDLVQVTSVWCVYQSEPTGGTLYAPSGQSCVHIIGITAQIWCQTCNVGYNAGSMLPIPVWVIPWHRAQPKSVFEKQAMLGSDSSTKNTQDVLFPSFSFQQKAQVSIQQISFYPHADNLSTISLISVAVMFPYRFSHIFVALILFTHTWNTPRHSRPNSKNIFQSFQACLASHQLQLNVGCLETTQNLTPNWATLVLHPTGRRLATLLCKLRIIRQSEFKITPGTLEGGREAENQLDDVVSWPGRAGEDLIWVFVSEFVIILSCVFV